ncbi:hypothetical protein R3I94_015427 [Phoxinus phoxinus]
MALFWLSSRWKGKPVLRRTVSRTNSEPALALALNQHLVLVGGKGRRVAAEQTVCDALLKEAQRGFSGSCRLPH